MKTNREVMQQVLDAWLATNYPYPEAIARLSEALARPEKEPCPYCWLTQSGVAPPKTDKPDRDEDQL